MSALVYVDGVTVTTPLEEALRRGINDVPVLLQSMCLASRDHFRGRPMYMIDICQAHVQGGFKDHSHHVLVHMDAFDKR